MGFWDNIDKSTARELARAAGLRTSSKNAVLDLAETYGDQPDVDFINDMWIVLRDGWLTRAATARQKIVEKLQAIGRGDMAIKTSSKKRQLDYLRSVRRSPALSEIVLKVFIEWGENTDKASETKKAYAKQPKNSEEQEKNFYDVLLERFKRLDKTTIESMERAVFITLFHELNSKSLPVSVPVDEAAKLTSLITLSLLSESSWEKDSTELVDHQKYILKNIDTSKWNTARIKHMLDFFKGTIELVLKDKEVTEPGRLLALSDMYFMCMFVEDKLEEFPEGFMQSIVDAQRRFASSAKHQEQFNEHCQSFDEFFAEIMVQIPNSTKPTSEKDGSLHWQVFMGSAMVLVIRRPCAEGESPSILLLSPLIRNVTLTHELLVTLNAINSEQRFMHAYWKDNNVMLEYEFVFGGLTDLGFLWLLQGFLAGADYFDTKLKNMFGGSMIAEDQKAVFDA